MPHCDTYHMENSTSDTNEKRIRVVTEESSKLYLAVNSRATYSLRENNAFSLKNFVMFSGRGIQEASSKIIVDFLVLFGKDKDGNINDDLHDRISKIVHADIMASIIRGRNGQEKEMLETGYDAESRRGGYGAYFYDKETDEVFTYGKVGLDAYPTSKYPLLTTVEGEVVLVR